MKNKNRKGCLHSNSSNNWSGMAVNLPFYDIIVTPGAQGRFWEQPDKENHGDSGAYDGYYTVEFY